MIKGMCRCGECKRWFFNWRKLSKHLIEKHGYEIELPIKEEIDNDSTERENSSPD